MSEKRKNCPEAGTPMTVEMETRARSKCVYCEHKIRGKIGCLAFPGGIPMPILVGDIMHDDPYPGDNGIQFQQRKDI